MITKSKLGRSFGPVGNQAGILLFVVGLILTYSSFYGLILVLLGAFVGFSSTSAIIDPDRKRVKFSNNLFGILETGKWFSLDKSMKLGVKESNLTWSAYSRGNRSLDVKEQDFRIALYAADGTEIMEIKKSDSPDALQAEMETLAAQLGLETS
ncbi:MAG: hypothetical protein WCR72_11605 [Bacteroidota bacterium]